jgi:chromosome partitioning protein
MQKMGDIDDALLDLNDRYEYVIVDVAGRDSRELGSGLTVCHTIVIPFRPSRLDLDRLPHMAEITRKTIRINPKMRVVAFLNSAPTNTQGIDAELARTAIAQFPGIDLLETTVHDRRIYRDAMSEGLTVEEMTEKTDSALAAKAEMINLLKEILDEAI